MGWRGVDVGGHRHKKKLRPRNINFFVIDKYIRDIKQCQKIGPDLLESIMKPSDPAKEELRLILFKMSEFRSEIQEFGVSTFWMSSKSRIPAGGQHSKRA